MGKLNCWESKKCGREPGGVKALELGACPAAVDQRLNGVNSGVNGGRACWVLAGTFCGGKVQGIFAMKMHNCVWCEFYQNVHKEEAADFMYAKDCLAMLG